MLSACSNVFVAHVLMNLSNLTHGGFLVHLQIETLRCWGFEKKYLASYLQVVLCPVVYTLCDIGRIATRVVDALARVDGYGGYYGTGNK